MPEKSIFLTNNEYSSLKSICEAFIDKEGMILTGTVRNVIDFGVFVDISVHQDGLVHISEISKDYIKHPSEVLKVGDVVKVKVIGVDVNKKRISLTIKGAVDDELTEGL